MSDDEDELIRRAAAETKAACENDDGVILALNPHSALCLASQLQLALRHPANDGVAADVNRTLLRSIVEQLKECGYPATAELVERGGEAPLQPEAGKPRGNDPANDVDLPRSRRG